MRAGKRWLLCDGNKVPHYVTYKKRGSTDTVEDLAQLATFMDAVDAAEKSFGLFGLGFALGPDGTGNHWQGIDLDNVPENFLSGIANDLPGYVEFSLSGNGCHAYGYGRPFTTLGSNDSGVEAYSQGRYFVVTGNKIRGQIVCIADYVATHLVPRHAKTRSDKTNAVANDSTEIITVPPATITDLRLALVHMRSDDYELWIAMGHALRELGDVGRGLWLDWSAASTKFNSAKASRKWDGFHPSATGYQAVFAAAQKQGWLNPKSNAAQAAPTAIQSSNGELHRTVVTRCGADITAVAIKWLWPGWVPAGKLTILAGSAGTGKTTLALALAATLTAGGNWPDKSPGHRLETF